MAQSSILTKSQIARMRLANQLISRKSAKSPREIVSWMGAMQAQDFEGVMWAIGLRTGNATKNEVETAYNKGEILRTHLLRPTWHMVAAKDLPWLLELTAQKIKTGYNSRNRQLGFTEAIFKQSNRIIHRTLDA